jgi:four helix bundle protein
MRNPAELQVFGLSDALVFEVYRLSASFPADERYGLTQQIRRSVVSISSNIVEGCSRESQTDFRRFIEIATGSAMELRHQLSLANRLGFGGPPELWTEVTRQADASAKALIAFGKALRAQTPNPKP